MKVSFARRRFCHWLGAGALALPLPRAAWASAQVSAARVWPSREYTRLTIETSGPDEQEAMAALLELIKDRFGESE